MDSLTLLYDCKTKVLQRFFIAKNNKRKHRFLHVPLKFPMNFWAMRKKTLFFTGKESVMIARGSYKERILKICLNAELNGLLLLDEFQFIQGISTMLKLLTDKFGNLRILCSGSSSLDILQNIEAFLMGRVRVIEVLSLSLGLSFVD